MLSPKVKSDLTKLLVVNTNASVAFRRVSSFDDYYIIEFGESAVSLPVDFMLVSAYALEKYIEKYGHLKAHDYVQNNLRMRLKNSGNLNYI